MNKIDQIIDALSRSVPVLWNRPDQVERHAQALAIARKLKAMQPVGTFAYDSENEVWEQLVPDEAGIKLYSLDEVKK